MARGAAMPRLCGSKKRRALVLRGDPRDCSAGGAQPVVPSFDGAGRRSDHARAPRPRLRDAPRGRYLLSSPSRPVRASSRARNASKSRRASRFDTARLRPVVPRPSRTPNVLLPLRHHNIGYRQILPVLRPGPDGDDARSVPSGAEPGDDGNRHVRDQLKEEYDILDEMGRGGMAIVFKARERSSSARWPQGPAVSRSRSTRNSSSGSSARRARRQARAPSIIPTTASASRAASYFVLKVPARQAAVRDFSRGGAPCRRGNPRRAVAGGPRPGLRP